VYRGTLSLPGAKKPSTVAVLQVHLGNVAAEVRVLLKLGQNQPRLVQFFGQCIDGTDTLMVMELAPMGSLNQALESIEDAITPGHRVAMLQQVCSAMETLVTYKLIHRDLALRNVLLFGYDSADVSKTSVKVSDFGLTVSDPRPRRRRRRAAGASSAASRCLYA
jgi:serine/threonine protein kinase